MLYSYSSDYQISNSKFQSKGVCDVKTESCIRFGFLIGFTQDSGIRANSACVRINYDSSKTL